MSRKPYAALGSIRNDRQITAEADREFLNNLQQGLLLAILENGTLTQMQYQYAREKLRLRPLEGLGREVPKL